MLEQSVVLLDSYNSDQSIAVDVNGCILKHTVIHSCQKIHIVINDGVSCKFFIQDVQDFENTVPCKIEYNIHVKRGSNCDLNVALLYARDISIILNVYLLDEDAKANIKGVYVLCGNQRLSIQTLQHHGAIATKSNLVLKGLVKDNGCLNYKGLIFIDKRAKKAQASQENKNIVLSKQARIVSTPSLEVLQHDVQCRHGSAIGQFDEISLWYMLNKGFDKDMAYAILIRAFIGNVVDEFEGSLKLEEEICQKII